MLFFELGHLLETMQYAMMMFVGYSYGMKTQLLMIAIDFDRFSIPGWTAESCHFHPVFGVLWALVWEYLPLALESEVWLLQLVASFWWVALLNFVEYFLRSGFQVISSIHAVVQFPRLLLIFGLVVAYLPPGSLVASWECSVLQYMLHIWSSCPATPLLQALLASWFLNQ